MLFKKTQIGNITNSIMIVDHHYFIKYSDARQIIYRKADNEALLIDFLNQNNVNWFLKTIKTINREDLYCIVTYFKPNAINGGCLPLTDRLLFTMHQIINQLHNLNLNLTKFDWKWEILNLQNYSNQFFFNTLAMNRVQDFVFSFFNTYEVKKWVVSHNDLFTNNILFDDDQWYLIDYEFCSLNDHLYDIASFIAETIYFKTETQPQLRTWWTNKWCALFNLNKHEIMIVNYWITYLYIFFINVANYRYNLDQYNSLFLTLITKLQNNLQLHLVCFDKWIEFINS